MTLPLHTNYGGVLQAFALQTVLERMGHAVEIIQPDRILPEPEGLECIRKILTRSLRKHLPGQRDVELFRERRINREFPTVGREFVRFFSKYLNIRYISSPDDIRPDDYDAFVVGSDQVWRPRYNSELMRSYLDFTWEDRGRSGRGRAAGWDVRRIAYAVSFGSDVWEYSARQTETASVLARRFNALSFREKSGEDMARRFLGAEAVAVLDPTMLLQTGDYLPLLGNTAAVPDGGVFEYILDRTPEGTEIVAEIERGIAGPQSPGNVRVNRFLASDPRGRGDIALRIQPSVEEWIAGIAGSSFVVTDSFHACVFAILFHKRFAVLGNEGRGLSRIEWLLGQYGLQDRLVLVGPCGTEEGLQRRLSAAVDWNDVDARLAGLRTGSMSFLKNSFI